MKTKNIKDVIREHFFIHPTERFRVRQIERLLDLPLPSVIRYCKELEKEGILQTVKIGDVVFYTANRSDRKFLLEKKLFNLKSLYSSGLINFLIDKFDNPSIIAFGSYSRGEDIEKSDIDLYIEMPSKKEIDPKDLKRFEKILKREIEIFRHESIHEVKNSHLANNIINGVVINGFVEVFE